MAQNSRIAPTSDLRTVAKGRKPPRGRVHAVLRQVAVLALLAALVYATPALVGPNFLHDQARRVMAFAVAAGDWGRTGLLALFQSIPVR